MSGNWDSEDDVDELREENKKLRDAAEFAMMTLSHAIHLDYLGEGSTRAMAKDAITRLEKSLSRQVSKK